MHIPVANIPNNDDTVTLDFTSNVTMSDEKLIEVLSNIDNMSDREAYKIVS